MTLRQKTIRDWLKSKIYTASKTAIQGRYYDVRMRAAERERTLRGVLRQLELSNADLCVLPKKGRKSSGI